MTKPDVTEIEIRNILGSYTANLLAFVEQFEKSRFAFAIRDELDSYLAYPSRDNQFSEKATELRDDLRATLRTLASLSDTKQFTLAWLTDTHNSLNLTYLIHIAHGSYDLPQEEIPHSRLWWRMRNLLKAQGVIYAPLAADK